MIYLDVYIQPNGDGSQGVGGFAIMVCCPPTVQALVGRVQELGVAVNIKVAVNLQDLIFQPLPVPSSYRCTASRIITDTRHDAQTAQYIRLTCCMKMPGSLTLAHMMLALCSFPSE